MTPYAHWHIEGQNGPMSNECADRGIISFQSLLEWVEQLPYKRTSEHKYQLVFDEECGTCSTKNALVKAVALENSWVNVKLYVGMYEMTEDTNPGVGDILIRHQLATIPEAHVYLKIDGKIKDVTGLPSGKSSFNKTLRFEEEIHPNQIESYKKEWHKLHSANTAKTIGLSTEKLWEIREECIAILAEE